MGLSNLCSEPWGQNIKSWTKLADKILNPQAQLSYEISVSWIASLKLEVKY